MDAKTVVIRGLKGELGRLGTLGSGLFGWYDIVWDGFDKNDSKYHWTMTKPDSKFAFQQGDAWLGADNTQFSDSIAKQFYGKPNGSGGRGAYESPVVYDNTLNSGLLGVVEYTPNSGGFTGYSSAFAVEVV